MKKLLVVLTLLTFLGSAPIAMAHPAYRARIGQAWKRVEAAQKRQAEQLKAIEREAATGFARLRVHVEDAMPGNVNCPAGGYRRTAP